MARKSTTDHQVIMDYINKYFDENCRVPSIRDIAAGTNISFATIHRHLKAMQEAGDLVYNGRKSIMTERMSLEDSKIYAPVVGYVACGEGQEEVQQIVEYIRLPEAFVGKGEFFVLIAKGESMIDAGVHPGDYVIIRRQKDARVGEYIVALSAGVSNLKELAKGEHGKYCLRSCNKDKEKYPDIPVDELEVQGVAVGVMHKF